MDAPATPTPYLRLQGIGKTFGNGVQQTEALRCIDLDVREGEFLALVGPSGCGKSTLLQIAAGLTRPTRGEVRFGDACVDRPPPGIVYLFQQYAKSLFPWRTVIDNVAFAVEHRPGMGRAAARRHSRRYLEMVGLFEFAQRYPAQLSGGMQQRVTIARALAAEPRVLLMDEPFSSVDALTRMDEAVFLADRIAVLSPRPSTVVQMFETRLPRPRDKITTPELPRYLTLRHELLSQVLGARP